MLAKCRSCSGWGLPPIAFILIIVSMTLVGCASSTATTSTSEVAPPAPSLEVAPTLIQPTTPPPTKEVSDFRTLLPTAPPEYGTLANHLVFFSDRSGTYELYQIDPDGSNLVQLTNTSEYGLSAYDLEPAWSTDGKIAFTSTHVNGSWEVFVLESDSREPTQITSFNGDSWSLAWSPDGKMLAFVSNFTGDDEIYLTAFDGNTPTNLTRNPVANDFLPVWSPDGQQLAFVSDRAGIESEVQELQQDIYVMASDGSEVTRLTDVEGRNTSPNWSPDGEKIAFVTDRDGNFEVYVMNADGSNPVRFTRSASYEWSPTWSPDEDLIAYTSTGESEVAYDVYVMAPDGSNQTQLTFDAADDIIPRWWP